jgi:hypothetical protein
MGTDDYKDLDVRGKYVIAQGGPPSGGSSLEIFASMPKKRAMARSKGALGLIELYGLGFNWGFFRNYFSKNYIQFKMIKMVLLTYLMRGYKRLHLRKL